MSSASSSGADSSFATESFLESIKGGLFAEGGCAGSSCACVDVAIVSLECECLQEIRPGLKKRIGHAGI